MAVSKKLTSEEFALSQILLDDSGIEFLEFALKDDQKADRCTRLRPYQWAWYMDDSHQSISACARDVGKSFRIIAKGMAFVHAHPGFDWLLVAPGQDHLKPVATKLEALINSIRFIREMLDTRGRQTGISKNPSFTASFQNGAKLVTRLPKEDGVGVKGQHALHVTVDEGQDFPEPAWEQLYPTNLEGTPGWRFEIYGVTVGSNSTFDRLADDPDTVYTVLRKIAPEKEEWGEELRRNAKKKYISERSMSYTGNIFGRSTGQESDLFVTARLMACVRIAQNTWAEEYNSSYYYHKDLYHDELGNRSILSEIAIPISHQDKKYVSYWGGMDIGLTIDPTELLIFGAYESKEQLVYRLLTRLSLHGIDTPNHIELLKYLRDWYGRDRFRRIAFDGTGLGLPFSQIFLNETQYSDTIRGYNFSQKLLSGWEDRELKPRESLKDLEIYQLAKQYGLVQARLLVDRGGMELPMDVDLLSSMQGIGGDHCVDAIRCFGIGVGQYEIEKLQSTRKTHDVIIPVFGWGN